MGRKAKYLKKLPILNVKQITGIGLILLLIVMTAAGYVEGMAVKRTAQNTMDTLKQQCISFNKVIAADKTKSLFRMSDMMIDLSYHIAEDNVLLDDEYLERYVDNMRLTGVAVLDKNLLLEASGYTRGFRNPQWEFSDEGSRYADIIEYPEKIFAERLYVDGEYYDVAAVSRKDSSGMVIGFFQQPSGVVVGIENDLESLVSGLQLERDGQYIISEDSTIRVSSDKSLKDKSMSDCIFLKKLSRISKDDSLHLFWDGRKGYWGYRSGCENYVICVYYPLFKVLAAWFSSGTVFAAVYFILCCLYFAVRNRTLYENHEKLQESNHRLTETVEMLQALETIYFTLFYVDLEHDRYKTIYITPWLKDKIPLKGIYTELKQTFLDTMIVDKDQEKIDQRMSIRFIQDALNRKNTTDVRKSFYTDYRALRGDITKWCRASVTVVDYDKEGKPAHVLALLQDVDKEKAREAAYQEQIEKEAQSAKIANAAKTEFLRRISHDIRTPINGIQGYVNMSAEHPGDPEIQEHCRNNVNVALHTLMELVNSVLEMSKLESEEIVLDQKPFDLNELLDEVHAISVPQAETKKISYEVQRSEKLEISHLVGSPRHISQILMNLVSNAIKYGKTEGYLHLDTHEISRSEDQITYEFVCEDNGIGMGEEFQKHLFEPFAQEKENARTVYEGTGLGLSIVKKLVDALGGTILCHSEKNVGTRFSVQLTFQVDKDYRDFTESTDAVYDKLLKEKNILLVEDNELNMELAEIFLTERGVNVTKAWNGQEGVNAFVSSECGFYDLIIMDIMMPVMDGLTATRIIRGLDRKDAGTVPITAMSANAFEDDVRKSLNAGMNAHIAKPVDAEKLFSVISELLDRKENRET